MFVCITLLFVMTVSSVIVFMRLVLETPNNMNKNSGLWVILNAGLMPERPRQCLTCVCACACMPLRSQYFDVYLAPLIHLWVTMNPFCVCPSALCGSLCNLNSCAYWSLACYLCVGELAHQMRC